MTKFLRRLLGSAIMVFLTISCGQSSPNDNYASYHVTEGPGPSLSDADVADLIAGSDDLNRYRWTFAHAARNLIIQRRCVGDDFRQNGGWIRSIYGPSGRHTYFTYCGGHTQRDKVLLDAETGRFLPNPELSLSDN